LLTIKQLEKRKRQQEEVEEQEMQDVLQKRLELFKATTAATTKTKKKESLQFVDALVRMHGTDIDMPSFKTKKGKALNKTFTAPFARKDARQQRSTAASLSKKSQSVAKKSRRSKY
jgi:hypothetical protein